MVIIKGGFEWRSKCGRDVSAMDRAIDRAVGRTVDRAVGRTVRRTVERTVSSGSRGAVGEVLLLIIGPVVAY